MDHNGNGPHDVWHQRVQEDGRQGKGEEGLKRKESTPYIKRLLWDIISTQHNVTAWGVF